MAFLNVNAPNLTQPNSTAASFINDDLIVYCQRLKNIHSDYKERFQNILNMDILDWVDLDPFQMSTQQNHPS